MPHTFLPNEFVRYLVESVTERSPRLPSLADLGKTLNISVARLREQLEAARVLGFVEARPRTGMRRLPYSFLPAVRSSLSYAIAIDPAHFAHFSNLRDHLEAAYWEQAVRLLTPEDLEDLLVLVESASRKLLDPLIQIPHREHRALHLGVFRRLDNPFVTGILEAYWEAYEAVGLSRYADYDYLQEVWKYHRLMVEAICSGDYGAGYQALVDHKNLIHHRSQAHPIEKTASEPV